MSSEDAKTIIQSALDKAMQKGVYTLQDSVYIVEALTVIFPSEETTNN